ncbi:hypothetical protein SODALDRAFT_331308 [Sodiomyces alkalinus F11]|uniref:Symplekin/Pta1 N-terminal domain-containing protein n=1 Tax=Sodiomyces alkalinus (strain CBS 110278 / VKM F-3762 / F11) TaxID=1314773 RepID=A0A3N2Q472_SODAK|nr:hypothetical protein SODALDRAFT_331308 [Sodiomyces alkalinus F11]ROT41560.1 hypothetical protein SODALDRAFT_331308 [Sodiomyces alkalinus F11]
MPAPQLSVSDQIRQLNDARKLVLGDVKYYSSVIKSILPIISPSAHIELRRWGVDFLAEAFATPAIPLGDKETLQPFILETLKDTLEDPGQDIQVLRSAIQAAASIYPLTLRWIINNSYDNMTWEHMTKIKARILQIWEKAEPSVRICCVKFAQRVVLAQSPVNPQEPRRGDSLDISLDKVPPNHQTLDVRTLEAEAAGLLDRILGGLQDHSSDALLVDAILNSLAILVRTRPNTVNRIFNAIFNFNPFKLANSPVTPRNRVLIKSMEKTTRMLLLHIAKRDPHSPLAQRIQQHVEGMMRMRSEILEEAGRKRALEAQSAGADAKRQRTQAPPANPEQLQVDPLPPGRHNLADVYTLSGGEGLKGFDISTVPAAMVAKINVSTLARINPQLLSKAVEGIKGRFAALAAMPIPELDPNTAPLGVDEDEDDDYEPDFFAAEDTEQILNKLDGQANDQPDVTELSLKSFKLPPPTPLTPEAALGGGQGSVLSLLEFVKTLEDVNKRPRSGINRLAAGSNDRESWIAIVTRLASRCSAEEGEISIKDEYSDSPAPAILGDSIRESLYTYVLEDFRRRIDVAITWLAEEWYNDRMQQKEGGHPRLHYEKWALKLIDGFSQYLHAQDKVLTRFLGEIPDLTAAIFSRVKLICRDPSVVPLALTSLLYVVMMRPPAKELALDTVQEIWQEYEEARPMAGKYLAKFRPAFLEAATRDAENNGTATSSTAVAAA